jgi:hypothetical protein
MMNPTDDFFPTELSSLVDAELAKGERITWIGRPIPWLLARSSLPMVLFGIPFTAFALFWIALISGMWRPAGPSPPAFFVLFGIPFVLVGLGMLTSPLWMYWKALRTVYAITDRRALSIERGIWGRVVVRSFDPPGLAVLSRTQHADGSGNLVFQREYRREGHEGRHGRFVDIGFLAVPDVKEVEDRIRELARKASTPSGDPR